jgi:small neutral amino acid transporter SnatA (MarC family)
MNSVFGDSLWAFMVVGGFIILGAAIAFAMLRNKTTASQDRRTEQATRDLYKEQSRDDAANR